MNKYNFFIKFGSNPDFVMIRKIFLVSRQFNCSNIIIFVNEQYNNEITLEILEELSIEYDIPFKLIVDNNIEEESTNFGIGVYENDVFKIVSDIKSLFSYLGENTSSQEKLNEYTKTTKEYQYKGVKTKNNINQKKNFRDIFKQSKNSVKYKQYSRKLKK